MSPLAPAAGVTPGRLLYAASPGSARLAGQRSCPQSLPRSRKRLAFALLASALLIVECGCANQIMSDGSIAETTAALLGQPPSSLRITDRRYDGMTNTYYTATTAKGVTYRCVINGGSLLSAGLANPPSCNRG